MDGSSGEEVVTGGQSECASTSVAWGNFMRDVHDLNLGVDAQNHAFHGSDEPVGGAEVRCQSDDTHDVFIAARLADSQTIVTMRNLPSGRSATRFSTLMEKVVIIGTGCAGLTAALYAARANLSPLVLTGSMPGGLLTTTSIVENFPGFPEGIDGYELMTRMQKQAERFGARVKFGTVEAVDLSKRPFRLSVDGEFVETETLIIASGASHRHLGLESEDKL